MDKNQFNDDYDFIMQSRCLWGRVMEKIKISHTSDMHGDGTMSLYVEGWRGTPGKPIKVSAEYVEKHQPRPGGYHVIEDDGSTYYINEG